MTKGQLGLAAGAVARAVSPIRVPDQKTGATMNVKDPGNRVVLITGAGSGIGRRLALPCARPASAAVGERVNGHA
jgi:hypothetical protein